MRPLLDLDFRTTYIEGGVLYTPSRGSLVTRAVMGTGVLGNASAPTITPIGASFDGSDYLDTGAANLFDTALPRTMVCRLRALDSVGTKMLCSTYMGVNPHMYMYLAPADFTFVMSTAAGSISVTTSPLPFRRPMTLIAAYDGTGVASGVTLFVNGERSVAASSGSISGSLLGSPLRIGAHPGGGHLAECRHHGAPLSNPTLLLHGCTMPSHSRAFRAGR